MRLCCSCVDFVCLLLVCLSCLFGWLVVRVRYAYVCLHVCLCARLFACLFGHSYV